MMIQYNFSTVNPDLVLKEFRVFDKSVTNTISVIRDRYQITLPDSIRKDLNWVKPNQPVKISIDEKNRIVIEPYEGKNID